MNYEPKTMNGWEYFWDVMWKNFWNSTWGKVTSVGLFVLAIGITIVASCVPCIGVGAWVMFGSTFGIAAAFFVVGAAISGLQSVLAGGSFWEEVGSYITNNWSETLAVTSILYIASMSLRLICGPKCFKEGTLVETEDGLKPIEEIQVGDKVLAYDEETGKQDYKTVLHLFRNESKDWVKVTVNGAEIESTPGHKYFLPKIKKWVSAEELKVGTKVLLIDGSYGTVEAVERISYDTPQTTYNFEVEEYHTYYVGSQCVCVHNQNCGVSEMHYKDLPDDARSAYDQYSQNGWKGNVKGQTTNAGGKWLNSKMQLPTSDSLGNALTYREFDIKMNMPRGSSRFVVSNQMQVYYTPDHYATFFKIIGG